jgi:hypothetical protein
MSELSQVNDRTAACQRACLDELDTCVTHAGYASSDCYKYYSECGGECDRIRGIQMLKQVDMTE